LFRRGEYREAMKKYARVFLYIQGLLSKEHPLAAYSRQLISTEQTELVIELKASTLLYMAAIDLRLENWTKAVERTTKALEIRSSAKAYFSRGTAYLKLNEFERAEADFRAAQALDPEVRSIEMAFKELSIGKRRGDQAADRVYGRMFRRFQEES
jgi:tetratricopeptide (TPR) repeat protein